MKAPPEEKPAGVPAYMATFADLMTLLLVFFILLNVYAKEKQHGLIAAASGSFREALQDSLGMGGLLDGSREIEIRNHPTHKHQRHDAEGKKTDETLRGDEVELGKAEVENIKPTESLEYASPVVFGHGQSSLPAGAPAWLDKLARDLRGGPFVVQIQTAASFVEAVQPMELACDRAAKVADYLREIGLRVPLDIRAAVVKNDAAGAQQAPHRALLIRIERDR